MIAAAMHPIEEPDDGRAPTADVRRSATTSRILASGTLVGAQVAASYAMHLLVARATTLHGFGMFVHGLAVVGLGAGVAMGPGSGLLRFLPQYAALGDDASARGYLRWARRTIAYTTIVVAVVVIAGQYVYGRMDGQIRPDEITRLSLFVAAAVPAMSFARFQSEALRVWGFIRTSRVLPWSFVPGLTAVVALAALVVGETSRPWEVFAATFVVAALLCLALQHGASPVEHRRLRGRTVISDTPTWLRVVAPMTGTKIAQAALRNVDTIVVATLVGPVAAGLYAAARKSASLIALVVDAVVHAQGPTLAVLFHSGDRRRFSAELKRSMLLSGLPGVLLGGLMLVLGETILGLFGETYADALPVFRIMLVGYVLNGFAQPVGSMLNATGHQNVGFVGYLGAALMNFVLLLALVPQWGSVGAAVATTATMVAWDGVLLALLRRVEGTREMHDTEGTEGP